MRLVLARVLVVLSFGALCWFGRQDSQSQEPGLPGAPAPGNASPQGVEVLARGPVHEAFATPTAEPKPTGAVNKKPPAPLDEMAPEDRPEGDMVWIAGYWGLG